jgi:hypothetical protein
MPSQNPRVIVLAEVAAVGCLSLLAAGYSGEKVHDILNKEKKIFTCVVVLNKIDEQHMLF